MSLWWLSTADITLEEITQILKAIWGIGGNITRIILYLCPPSRWNNLSNLPTPISQVAFHLFVLQKTTSLANISWQLSYDGKVLKTSPWRKSQKFLK